MNKKFDGKTISLFLVTPIVRLVVGFGCPHVVPAPATILAGDWQTVDQNGTLQAILTLRDG